MSNLFDWLKKGRVYLRDTPTWTGTELPIVFEHWSSFITDNQNSVGICFKLGQFLLDQSDPLSWSQNFAFPGGELITGTITCKLAKYMPPVDGKTEKKKKKYSKNKEDAERTTWKGEESKKHVKFQLSSCFIHSTLAS